MHRSNPKKLVRQVLTSLKRQYGDQVQVYKLGSESVNWDTGTRTVTDSCVEVDNCIVLPVTINSEVVQSISYISSNKPFIQGGYFGTGKRKFIFDFTERRGLPRGYTWDLSDWIIADGNRYDVESFEELHFGSGWMVTAARVQGVTPQQTFKENITHTLQLRLNHTVDVVIE